MKRREAIILGGSALLSAVAPESAEASEQVSGHNILTSITVSAELQDLASTKGLERIQTVLRGFVEIGPIVACNLLGKGLPEVEFEQGEDFKQALSLDLAAWHGKQVPAKMAQDLIKIQTDWVRAMAITRIGKQWGLPDPEIVRIIEDPDLSIVTNSPLARTTAWVTCRAMICVAEPDLEAAQSKIAKALKALKAQISVVDDSQAWGIL